jgi:perosamine synthetase
VAQRYAEAFAEMRGVRWIKEPDGSSSNYWLNAILLDDDDMKTRDSVLQACHDAGFLVRPAWTLMHRLAMFKDSPRDDLANAESIERRLINLPSSAVLGLDDALHRQTLAASRA